MLKERRESLNLSEGDVLGPIQKTEKELLLEEQARNGGVVLMGRPTMKEYLAGLKMGWGNGVGEWKWEDSVKATLSDEPFAEPATPTPPTAATSSEDLSADVAASGDAAPAPAAGLPAGGSQMAHVGLHNQAQKLSLPPVEDDEPQHQKKSWFGGLFGHGGKKQAVTPGVPTPQQPQQPEEPVKFSIPPNWHEPPHPLPPHAPVLLVDWCNHLGFKQIPYMIYDFFTEHKRVKAGAEAAYALITEQARPFRPPTSSSTASTSSEFLETPPSSETSQTPAEGSVAGHQGGDLDFDVSYERYYKKDYAKTPAEVEKERKLYYEDKLPKRLEAARAFARGERELTAEEKKSDKPIETVQMLQEERHKKELRWEGNLEGWEIVRPETPVAWDERFNGWLHVYEASPESLEAVRSVPEKNGESRLE